MKIYLNLGFILILTVIGIVTISAFNQDYAKIMDTFSNGFFFGMILSCGLAMLSRMIVINIKPKNKRNKIRVEYIE